MIEKLRTPDGRFTNLPGYNFTPHYLQNLPGYGGLRAHYLDEGNPDSAELFLCLHGQPTWSYLYRKMIPIFTQHGIRTIAPDYFGFGRSDKPIHEETYTFDFHRNFLLQFIQRLDLQNITLVCQDWGGLLGLTLPQEMPERFKRLLIMNTGFAIGQVNEAFLKWKEFNNRNPDLPIHKLMKRWTPGMSEAESLAYSAPFPGPEYKAGVRTFPNLVPTSGDMPGVSLSRQAMRFWKHKWTGQSFMAIGMQDPILGPDTMQAMHRFIRNCPAPLELPEAGHFVQEWGHIVAPAALTSFGLTSY
jgi:pimeloyl-ACP methyl ester carboxylesterase